MRLRLSLSKRRLRQLAVAVLAVATLVGLYFLGDHLTPRDSTGRPLIYSPSVRSAELYRRQVRHWSDRMVRLDRRLTALLAAGEITDPSQLYAASEEAQALVSQATELAEDVAFTPAPPALMGLSAMTEEAVASYYEAALAASQWIGAPDSDQMRTALETLRAARSHRQVLEESQWVRD